MNTLRFGKVVEDPNVQGVDVKLDVAIPYDVANNLEQALREGDKNKLEACINQVPTGALLKNSPTSTGDTLLHISAQLGYAKCAKQLVEQGKMDPNCPKANKSGPIHTAARGGHCECMMYFVSAGVNPSASTVEGYTPLHIICMVGGPDRKENYLNCISKLVSAGADINAKDSHGQTPLHKAAAEGDEPVVKHLLKLGADPQAKDEFGKTPGDIAEENVYAKLAKFLKGSKKSKGSGSGSGSRSSGLFGKKK